MALLHRFLKFLQLLEQVADFAEFLQTPTGVPLVFGLLTYQAGVLIGSSATDAALLASGSVLTLHCIYPRSNL